MKTDLRRKSTPDSGRTFLRLAFSAILLGAFTATALALDLSTARTPFVWLKQEAELPASISLYSGTAQSAEGLPIRAWYVDIDYSDKNLALRSVLAPLPKAKQPVSEMARAANALVAVNGGYFDMTSVPARTFSMVRQNGATLVPNISRITRRNGFYYVGRSAFGVREDRTFSVAWLWQRADKTLEMPAPLENTPASPAPVPVDETLDTWPEWNMSEAIGGGPMLLKNGEARVTYDEEVFFGSGFRGDVPYPRTAVGYLPNGHVILFVTDGSRPTYSVGLTLDELAEEMKLLGCTDAMNLDGGGSSTLAINGTTINIPSGQSVERNVSSMLAIVSANPVATPTE